MKKGDDLLSRRVEEMNKPLLSRGLRAPETLPITASSNQKLMKNHQGLRTSEVHSPNILPQFCFVDNCGELTKSSQTPADPGHASPLQQTAQGQLSVSAILEFR